MSINADETHLYLVRHGESDANRLGYVGGSTDDALTEKGHVQAGKVAAHLNELVGEIDALYCSPLKRAHQTAEYVGKAFGTTPTLIADLQEWHAGDWETLEYSAIPMQPEFTPEALMDPDFAPPNGESLSSVQARVVAALRELHDRHRGERIVVVSHGSALALALSYLVDASLPAWLGYRLENCSVSELLLGPDPRLIEANRTQHLLD